MMQDQLATLCNLVGFNISRGTLVKIKFLVRGITDEEVALLIKALKVDVSGLFN